MKIFLCIIVLITFLNIGTVCATDSNIEKNNILNNSSSQITNNSADVNKISTTKTIHAPAAAGGTVYLKVSEVYTASKYIKNYVSKNKKLPNYYTWKGSKIPISQILYVQSKVIVNANSGKAISVSLKEIKEPTNPVTSDPVIKGSLTKARYVSLAKSIISYSDKNKKSPNYATTILGKTQYQTLVDAFSRLVVSFYSKKSLPKTLSFNTKSTSALNKNIPKLNTNTNAATKIPLSSIQNTATSLKSYMDSHNGSLPSTVTVSGKSYKMAEYLYLISKAISNINGGVTSSIQVVSASEPSSPLVTNLNGKISKSNYVSLSKNVVNFISAKKIGPRYNSSSLGNIGYKEIIDGLTRVIVYHKTKGVLPNSLVFTPKSSVSNSSNSSSNTPVTALSISLIKDAAISVNAYMSSHNGNLPSTVTISGKSYKMAEYLYLISKAISNINGGVTSSIQVVSASEPSSPLATNLNGSMSKSNYVSLSKNVVNFIATNKIGPKYSSSSLGKIGYKEIIDGLTRVMVYYKTNNVLPNSLKFTAKSPASNSSNTPSTKLSITLIKNAAVSVKNYMDSHNGNPPSTVTISSIKYNMAQFMYLLSAAISGINKGSTADITVVSASVPTNPKVTSVHGKMSKANYISLNTNVLNYIKAKKMAPSYNSSSLGTIGYLQILDGLVRTMVFYKENSRLPSSLTYANSYVAPPGSGTNNNYLKATTRCQVTNSAIVSLAKKITNGKTTDLAKATAIFNYVRDNIDYDFYYDSKYGAVGTLNSKKGNCVDTSHLLIALTRASGIQARYVHGVCSFTSGSTYGHVWAEVLVGGYWKAADATSTRNSFGVVNNWDTSDYTLNGRYSDLKF